MTKTCIFCGNEADTREHIPSKQLFKGKLHQNLITVPSCKSCNSGYQNDEDFFKQFWASMLSDKSSTAKTMLNNEISRSIKRKPAMAMQMFKQMTKAEVRTIDGRNLGVRTVYKISKKDGSRIDRVVNKIVKGLYFHEFHEAMCHDWIVQINWITPTLQKKIDILKISRSLKWALIKNDTFAYGYNSVQINHQSIWILEFFGMPLFYVFVIDPENAKRFNSNKLSNRTS